MAKANKPTATTARSTTKSSAKPTGATTSKASTKSTAPPAKPAAKASTKSAAAPAQKAPAASARNASSTAVAQAPAKSAKPSKTGSKGTAAKATKPAEQPAPAAPARPAAGKAKPTASTKPATVAAPAVKFTKDGIGYTKDFDVKFLQKMQAQLLQEREELTGQATRLENEANALVAEAEMGDVQFDDEGGEGDTMVVERERDLALSAQARQLVADIDAALARLKEGTYGYSVLSGRPIPRERLEAIPWADVLVEEKAGGLGRR